MQLSVSIATLLQVLFLDSTTRTFDATSVQFYLKYFSDYREDNGNFFEILFKTASLRVLGFPAEFPEVLAL